MSDGKILKIFGFNMKVMRMKLGLTQFQLAEILNVHEKHICKLEAGKQNVTLKTLEKIAAALDVSEAYLLTRQ